MRMGFEILLAIGRYEESVEGSLVLILLLAQVNEKPGGVGSSSARPQRCTTGPCSESAQLVRDVASFVIVPVFFFVVFLLTIVFVILTLARVKDIIIP
mmetsp:Transcript_4737/g.13941  ORF Transcript_4737/g.13941 Transcript_4737/m.13941 type:complete len:98 (-) Transcript_4737:195-488(-)